MQVMYITNVKLVEGAVKCIKAFAFHRCNSIGLPLAWHEVIMAARGGRGGRGDETFANRPSDFFELKWD